MKIICCVICGLKADYVKSAYCYRDKNRKLLVKEMNCTNPVHIFIEAFEANEKLYGKDLTELLKKSSPNPT